MTNAVVLVKTFQVLLLLVILPVHKEHIPPIFRTVWIILCSPKSGRAKNLSSQSNSQIRYKFCKRLFIKHSALDLSFNNGNYVVSFDAKIWTYTTEATSILLLCNDVQQKEITLTTEMLNYSYDIANGLDSVIKFSAKNATKNRYFLDNISIQQQQPKKIYFYENYNVGNAIVLTWRIWNRC